MQLQHEKVIGGLNCYNESAYTLGVRQSSPRVITSPLISEGQQISLSTSGDNGIRTPFSSNGAGCTMCHWLHQRECR